MTKSKTAYVCDNCGYDSVKWLGKCPSCGAWNSFKEVSIASEPSSSARSGVSAIAKVAEKRAHPVKLSQVKTSGEKRTDTHDTELNRVLGGGIVPGSLVLIGGEPGIGKSTLMLQTVMRMPEKKVLYVSGEESEQQIKLRAERIENSTADILVICETSLENIFHEIAETGPDLVVIDSIQTIETQTCDSAPGSLTQIRECASALLKFAKQSGVPVFLIGHITKEGVIAGPKVLEHIVDVVLQFEGDRHYLYRILRGIKNRFGSTSELGKTTLVNKILANKKGIKFAVIVNDIGEVNIDADLIQQGGVVNKKDDSLVALQNGCICCTLKMDLIEQLNDIMKMGRFDYIVIEASGICEPEPIAQSIIISQSSTMAADLAYRKERTPER